MQHFIPILAHVGNYEPITKLNHIIVIAVDKRQQKLSTNESRNYGGRKTKSLYKEQ